jgi:hypothetical protein
VPTWDFVFCVDPEDGGGERDSLPAAGAPERASALEGTRCFELFVQTQP